MPWWVGTTHPMLEMVQCIITGEGDTALKLGPDTDESFTLIVEVRGIGGVVDAVNAVGATAMVSAVSAFGLKHGLDQFGYSWFARKPLPGSGDMIAPRNF